MKAVVNSSLIKLDEREYLLTIQVLRKCISRETVKCETTLLEKATSLDVDINVITFGDIRPLHCAAEILSPTMMDLFLKLGVQPDEYYHTWQSVDFALNSSRSGIYWTKEQSIFRLLFELNSEGKFKPMMHLRLLLKHLSLSPASELICKYVVDGKLIELAAIYLVVTELMRS